MWGEIVSDYKTDLEIAREAKKLKISEVASNRLSIDEKNLVPYGHFKAKLEINRAETPRYHLITDGI